MNAKAENLIVCLLREPTIERAAKAAGYSTRHTYRLLGEPEFKAAYAAARRDAIDQATARLQSAAGAAVSVLLMIAADKAASAGARVSAAKTILDAAYRACELQDVET